MKPFEEKKTEGRRRQKVMPMQIKCSLQSWLFFIPNSTYWYAMLQVQKLPSLHLYNKHEAPRTVRALHFVGLPFFFLTQSIRIPKI
jgi:hypothetical protein